MISKKPNQMRKIKGKEKKEYLYSVIYCASIVWKRWDMDHTERGTKRLARPAGDDRIWGDGYWNNTRILHGCEFYVNFVAANRRARWWRTLQRWTSTTQIQCFLQMIQWLTGIASHALIIWQKCPCRRWTTVMMAEWMLSILCWEYRLSEISQRPTTKYVLHAENEMQSETAGFALGAATSQTGRNILWFWPIRSIIWNYMTSSTNAKNHKFEQFSYSWTPVPTMQLHWSESNSVRESGPMMFSSMPNFTFIDLSCQLRVAKTPKFDCIFNFGILWWHNIAKQRQS